MIMSRPHRATIIPEQAAGSLSGETALQETSPHQLLPSVELPPSQVQAEPRTGRQDQRRLTFVHSLQVQMLSLLLSYSLIIFVMLAIPVFEPMVQALVDPALSWQERALVANNLLNLHARYWPWAFGAGIVLVIHCVHSMFVISHVIGPLKRFKNVFRQIGDGNLSIRTTLRKGDHLVPEAELVNQMTAQLRTRISASKQAQTTLALDVDRLNQMAATGGDPTLATLVKRMEQDLVDLKASLDWFKTHKG